MRVAMALAGAALVAVVVAMVLVLHGNHDATPGDVRACARNAGAKFVQGTDRLGPVRVDLLAGTLRPEGAQLRLRGGERAAFLVPRDRAYLLALVSRETIDDPARTVAIAPERQVLVAYGVGPGASRALRACVVKREA